MNMFGGTAWSFLWKSKKKNIHAVSAVVLFPFMAGNAASVRKEDNCLIGLIGLNDMGRYEQYKELEYAIAADYRRRGYGAEAVRGMLDFGFRQLDLSVIAAWVHAANNKSAHLLEKCGFTLEGRLRRHGRDRGDTLCYSILSEEFPY